MARAALDEPLRRRLGAAGRARFRSTFSEEAMAERLEAAFTEP